MNGITKENTSTFYRDMFRLALPIVMQNLITTAVSSADVVMLGFVSQTALAAGSLASQIMFILNLVYTGISSGIIMLAAQYWGKKDTRTIEKVMGISFRISIAAGIIFGAGAILIPQYLMLIFTSDQAVIAEGVSYLRIVGFSYVLSAFTNVYLNIIRSIERVVIATVVYGVSLCANIVFNSIYAQKKNDVVKIHIKDFFVKDKALGKDFFTYAFPVLLNEFAWGAGMAAISAIVGHLGSAAVAAHSVAQVCRQLSMVIGFGISSATAIMIGKAIGEKKEELAREYGRRFVKLSIICGIGGAVVILAISPLLPLFLKLTPLAKSYLTAMMLIMSYYVIGQSFNSTIVVGVLRAGGDTRFGLFLDVGVMWLCSIAGAAIGAFVIGIPMPWVYILLCSDEVIKIPFSLWRYKSYRWLRNVTR